MYLTSVGAVLDAPTSRKALPPKCSSSTITLVEAGMSDTLLGNQARAGYGGDNERLRSVVSLSASLVSLQNAAQLPRGEVPRKLSSPAHG